MTANVLKGKKIASEMCKNLASTVQAMQNFAPGLAIVQVKLFTIYFFKFIILFQN